MKPMVTMSMEQLVPSVMRATSLISVMDSVCPATRKITSSKIQLVSNATWKGV